MMNLLFTGGGGVGNESIFKQLSNKYNLYFADAEINNISNIIPINKKITIPFANNPNFAEKVIEICKKFKIDLVIPTVDEELLKWKKIANDYPLKVLLPQQKFIERNLDKYQSSSYLIENSILAPKTYFLSDTRPSGNFIMKPRFGRGSRGIQIVNNDAEIEAHLLLSKLKEKDFVLQEFIEGDEYTVTVASDSHGNLNAVVPVKIEIKKGITIRARTVLDEFITSYCSSIQEIENIQEFLMFNL